MGATSTRRTPRKSPPARKSRSPSPSPSRKKKATPKKKKSSAPSPIANLGLTLDAGQINALRDYKYHCLNRSVICNSSYSDMWEFVAWLQPMWVTPNMVTVVGALSSWSVMLVMAVAWTMHLEGAEPDDYCNLVCFGAYLLIAYNTLDNADGKLARRRGMGSPLGQMMDHGCDSLSIGMLMGALGFALALPPAWAVALWAMGSVQWIAVAWEEHHTGILLMDYFAADESEYSGAAIGIVSAFKGFSFWKASTYLTIILAALPAIIATPLTDFFASVSLTNDGELMTAITMCSLVGALLSSMSRVKDHVAGGGLSGWSSDAFVDSMRDMLPYVVYVGSCVYWATLIMSTLEDTILRTLWTIGVSTLFSRMALELIHDTLTHLTVPLIFWEMAVPVVGVLLAELAPEKTGDFVQLAAAGGFLSFLQKMSAIAVCYAESIGVNVLVPPEYDSKGKAIRPTFG